MLHQLWWSDKYIIHVASITFLLRIKPVIFFLFFSLSFRPLLFFKCFFCFPQKKGKKKSFFFGLSIWLFTAIFAAAPRSLQAPSSIPKCVFRCPTSPATTKMTSALTSQHVSPKRRGLEVGIHFRINHCRKREKPETMAAMSHSYKRVPAVPLVEEHSAARAHFAADALGTEGGCWRHQNENWWID